jgi:hypothetical protein
MLRLIYHLTLIEPSHLIALLYAGQPNSPPVSMCSCRISQYKSSGLGSGGILDSSATQTTNKINMEMAIITFSVIISVTPLVIVLRLQVAQQV